MAAKEAARGYICICANTSLYVLEPDDRIRMSFGISYYPDLYKCRIPPRCPQVDFTCPRTLIWQNGLHYTISVEGLSRYQELKGTEREKK